jgi:hypothetical protein
LIVNRLGFRHDTRPDHHCPELARLGTATNSANLAPARRLQQVVGHQPRLRERQHVPTRKDVGLDAEPVTSDPALQADREETVIIAG